MGEVRVGDGEVGSKHGRRNLVAVGAVADKAVNKPRALGWLII